MDKKQILNILAKEAAQAAKDHATATLAALSAEDLRPLVAEQLKTITAPLQAEIETTKSVWVRIRYRQFKTDLPSCRRNKQKAFRITGRPYFCV